MAKDNKSETPEQTAPNLESLPTLVAVRSHFVSVRDRAVANLNNYIFSPAGVGEHPDLVQECINLVEDIDRAESVLQTLSRITQ